MLAIGHIEWMHFQFSYAHQNPWPSKTSHIVFVIADGMAGVLTQEALDAFTEFLAARDILLLHSILARLQSFRRRKRCDFARLLIVE